MCGRRLKGSRIASTQAVRRGLVATYFKSTVSRWDEFYTHLGKRAVYTTIYRSRLERALSFVDGFGLSPGSRVLDIGCGPGIATVALARRGLLVSAIDIIDAQLDHTRQRASEAGVAERVVTSIGDIHKLDFGDGMFDLVFVIGVMEWLEDPNIALREIARVLKPGGRAILSVDNKWALRNILDPFMYRPFAMLKRSLGRCLRWSGLRRDDGLMPRDYSYSIRHFDRMVATAGLQKVTGMTLGFGPFPFLDLELPRALGLSLHHALQRLADKGIPVLRSGGLVYITVISKSR